MQATSQIEIRADERFNHLDHFATKPSWQFDGGQLQVIKLEEGSGHYITIFPIECVDGKNTLGQVVEIRTDSMGKRVFGGPLERFDEVLIKNPR